MFGIGTGELMIIALVALIVLGPERLPKAARFAGLWVRRARAPRKKKAAARCGSPFGFTVKCIV